MAYRLAVRSALVACVLVAMLSQGCAVKKDCDKCVPLVAPAQVSKPITRQAPAPAPVPRSTTCALPVITKEGGNVRATFPAPTGVANSSVVLIEKTGPAEVILGDTFAYNIKITNLTSCPLEEVVLIDRLPTALTFQSATPAETSVQGNEIRWSMGTLEGQQSKSVDVTVTAATIGETEQCVRVEYKSEVCMPVLIVQPNLELVKEAPAEVLICDPIPMKLTVRNPGSGAATNVKVTDTLPEGLTTDDGQTEKVFEVGTLAAGESRDFTFTAKATKIGQFVNRATAVADRDLQVDASATTIVRQPVLTITKTSTRTKLFVGQTFGYEITVTNTGDATAANTIITDTLPEGTSFVSASEGGELTETMVIWKIGDLAPNASQTVSMQLRADTITTVRNTARAEGVCADAVSASATTQLLGIPAILLETVDLEDPVPVGGQTTYAITTTNQGSAEGTNIKIVVTLEPEAQYVSSEGVTQGTLMGTDVVEFEALPTLAPKAKAIWKVVVKAVAAGDVRFSISMTSDQISRPVKETEATNFYE